MSWQIEYFGVNLLTKSGVMDATTALAGKRRIGLYFSANWCPPCRRFTPILAEFYRKMKGQNDDELEIVFISCDSDEASFSEYFAVYMPWIAMPFVETERNQSLSTKFEISGIPSLVILEGATGKLLDVEGRSTVTASGEDIEQALLKWPVEEELCLK